MKRPAAPVAAWALAATLATLPAPARAVDRTVANGADLVAAVNAAGPGDVITLLDGTFFVTAPLEAKVAASAAAPIRVVTAHGPHAATIVAQGAAEEPVRVSGAYWSFDGVDFQGGRYGIRFVGGGSDAVVRNARFIDNAAAGVRADCGGPDVQPHCDRGRLESISVRRAALTGECSFAGIELVGAANWVIQGLVVRDIFGDDLGCGSNLALNGVVARGNTQNLTLDTVIVRAIAIGLLLGPSTLNPCEVRGAIDPGTGVCSVPTTCALQSSLISNAIVWLATGDGIQLANACDVRVHNATLWNNGGATPRSIELLGSGTVDLSNIILNGPILNSAAVPTTGNGNLTLPSTADPTWFLDAPRGNFRLQPSVPPLDTGVVLADVPHDYDDLTRPQGSAYDVGAFERPPNGYPDGGVIEPDGGAPTDGGGGMVVPPPGSGGGGLGPTRNGCSCSFTGATPTSFFALALALALIGALLRRRLR